MNDGNASCKIILIDNSEQMRESIKEQLKNTNILVMADFADAVSALSYLKENEVDVVVTDIVLPNIDGYEFLENLNKLEKENKPKVLILSALSNDNFINKALSLGANYYMVKPCDINVLKTRVMDLSKNEELETVAVTSIAKAKPRNRQLEEKEIKFKTSRELREDAYLELTYMMTRGVSNWKEVQYDELPDKVQDKYTKAD